MVFPRVFPALAAAALTFLAGMPARVGARTNVIRPPVSGGYKGAIVLDAATGQVLFEDHADNVSPPASMTKLMTFAVLDDRLRAGGLTLQTPVRITPADARIGGSQVYLDSRETFPVEELIYAMIVQSANDAAHALAHAAAGSVEAFVELMNAKARDLGMTRTTFRSPHGLPPASRRLADGDLTTPRDFFLLSRYLLLKTNILNYTSVRSRSFGSPPRAKAFQMVNHDHLLGAVEGVDGLKTGYTNGAGFCLAATAQRGSHRVIVVTMDGDTSDKRDLKVRELIEHGFASLPPDSPPFVGYAAATAPAGIAPTLSISPAPLPRAATSGRPLSGSSSMEIVVPGGGR